MPDLDPKDLKAIEESLTREKERLGTLMREYQQHRGNTRNAVVKAMADEGNANMKERVAALDVLLAKLRAPKP